MIRDLVNESSTYYDNFNAESVAPLLRPLAEAFEDKPGMQAAMRQEKDRKIC
jgi:hypothetical protein